MAGMKSVIFGLSGPALSSDERAFLRTNEPAGYILFKRNIADREQVRALTDDLRALHARDDLPILIDQEGGRVARMRPPVWPEFPAGGAFDALYERAPISAMEAARVNALAIALILSDVGITVNCAPVLDVRGDETHDSIGDRAYGYDPVRVASLGRSVIDGFRQGGVVAVVKHMPGQGRSVVDSHHDLPVVEASDADLARDILPFERLNMAPMGMTGHVMFPAWDADNCATLSPAIIRDIIRGRIGFDGFLMSDDIDMKALSGDVAASAAAAVAAGCDVALHCSGEMGDMVAVAAALPDITDRARERLVAAMATIAPVLDVAELADLIAKRDALLALV
jgi:beta-N-acetylhexosaminidase